MSVTQPTGVQKRQLCNNTGLSLSDGSKPARLDTYSIMGVIKVCVCVCARVVRLCVSVFHQVVFFNSVPRR